MISRTGLLVMCAACAASVGVGTAWGQTPPTPRSVPFTEDFGAAGSTTFPQGFAGYNGNSGASITTQSGAEGSPSTGTAAIATGTPSNGGAGGLFYYAVSGNARIAVNTSSNVTNGVNQWVLGLNTSGQSAMTLSYDLISVIANARPVGTVAQYRVGHTGTWTTLPTVTGNPYLQAGGTTETVTHVTMALPSDMENQAETQVRFAVWRPTSPGGNSSAFAIDSLSVTSGSANPDLGACCLPSGTCLSNLAADCATAGGTFQNAGTACATVACPQPPGSCCTTGLGCTLVNSPAECTNGGGTDFVMNGACNPGPCIPAGPIAVLPGDIAYAPSNADATKTLLLVRGIGTNPPAMRGAWPQFTFIEFVRFDNTAGIYHNTAGNMLAANFGSATGGGPLYNYATDGSFNALPLVDAAGFGTINGSTTRIGGLSVNPDNTRIAYTGFDSPTIGVLSYQAGGTPGTGNGASVSGGAALTTLAYSITPKGTWGTAWLDNDTVIAAVRTDASTLKVYTIHVSGVDSATTFDPPVERFSVTPPGSTAGPQTAIAYNPQLSSYIYVLSSAFTSPTSSNQIYVIDPATWAVVKTIDLSTSLQTGRDLAIGNDHNLYLATHVDAGRSLISKLVLDADSNGEITPAEIAAIADNSSTDYFSAAAVGAPGFAGIDIGLSGSVVVPGACCSAGVCSTANDAASCIGIFQGAGTACNSVVCPQPSGACCTAGVCSTAANAAACLGVFQGAGTVCGTIVCPQLGACCTAIACTLTTDAVACVGGSFKGEGTACTASGVCGTCCRGATCNGVYNNPAACEAALPLPGAPGVHSSFATSGGVCNTAGNSVSPCCYANYNHNATLEVQDIFDFLNDWFAGKKTAIPGGDGETGALAVQNIFDFLNAWFAGGCH